MRAFAALLLLLLVLPQMATAQDSPVARCLSCHLIGAQIDITGVRALQHLPPDWPMLFEDANDRDGDGIAGRVRFVSGGGTPRIGIWGQSLAAARFQDFAQIAGAAHAIDVRAALPEIRATFERLSPAPTSPFARPADRDRFVARGCNACHVLHSYTVDGQQVMPLSDFLLHDLGNGARRTAPLWGCGPRCLDTGHAGLTR